MEMHQVRYFLAAAKTLSFTRAAEVCHVSQPALTTAIKKLEAQLGSPLFHREGRQVALTDFGRRMQPHLSQIVEQATAAETVAKDFQLLQQVPVRLGVMATIGPMRLAILLAAFEQQLPGVETVVRDGAPEALAAQLDADELDVAILNALDGLGDNYRAEPLYTERYVVLLPPGHPLRKRNALALRDLSEQPYVDRLSCEMREIVMGVCADMEVNYTHASVQSARIGFRRWWQQISASPSCQNFRSPIRPAYGGRWLTRRLPEPSASSPYQAASIPRRLQPSSALSEHTSGADFGSRFATAQLGSKPGIDASGPLFLRKQTSATP